MIHTDSFNSLADGVKLYVYRRIADVLLEHVSPLVHAGGRERGRPAGRGGRPRDRLVFG